MKKKLFVLFFALALVFIALAGSAMAAKTAKISGNSNYQVSLYKTAPSDWAANEIINAANVGLNYNLATGKELALTDVFSLSPNEIADYLKKQTKAYIDANPTKGWWDDAKLTVDRYTMDQYEYYIDGKNVCLCYPVYELGPGAMGPVIVKCPIV